MSLAELTDATFPRLSGRLLPRRRSAWRSRLVKTVRRRKMLLIRRVLAWQRSQYYLATAVRDLRMAAGRNEDIVLGIVIVATVVIFAVASCASQIMLQAFLDMSYLNDVTGFSVFPLVIMFAGVLATLGGWLAAWLCNALSISLMDSFARRQHKSLRSTLRRGLALAAWVATSWLALLTLLFAPIMAVGLVSLLLGHLVFGHGLLAYFYPLVLTAVSGTLWLLYASTTFGLAPQVALFSPELSMPDAFLRSRQLVARRGRPFILAAYTATAAFVAVVYGLTMLLQKAFGPVVDIIFYAAIFASIIALNLILTALYRKRRLARAN